MKTTTHVNPITHVNDLKPGVDLSYGELHETTAFNVNFAGAKLFAVFFTNLVISGASAQGANLECSRLYHIRAHDIDLGSANLTEARLYDCDFQDAKATGLRLYEATIENVSFKFADLRGADLRGAQFYGCDFSHADLRGADLRSATFHECVFREANLGSVDCSEWDDEQWWQTRPGTEFSRCDLAKVNWAGADVTDARFEQCAPDEGALRQAIDRNRRRRRS